ncbi:MAG: helicase [Cyanobacteria bacterium SW_4_48_29]|jgi:ATP-dependent DNA helicase DinG|nr:MAG: helicase [Cyanobacteria bacterium QH_7_48_89]PSO73070.1 MAG: helicase [Cyanobacteria bacterium QH_3_48_40]PSO82049.1 MAG: helicase [Cyanobacteria bacterium QS_5_48_63]PSO92106.1 MAG: helicase [Cyanobacteria bacterium QS_6_48_18]PSO97580.1 MAG: helicase [Cyanobacteria bacterium SW_12_48_29]PSP09796.1 MAG: helicase [Cyanobacteria bacterium SW_10_48_33]PSP26230.1 MAG: helicase [Cyanobacteria bacterium SW_4_48_29]
MGVIEAEVHSSLRAFLKAQAQPTWIHHLTMARLVARALRLGRPALIQTGSARARYVLSYLTPALLWNDPVILVAPVAVQQRLLQVEIPQLQQWLETNAEIRTEDSPRWEGDFGGIILASPATWLADRLEKQGRFPQGIPTLIDCAEDLEEWTRQQLTASIQPKDWEELMQQFPHIRDLIRDVRVQLTKAIFEHPQTPYECCLLEVREQQSLRSLFKTLEQHPSEKLIPNAFRQFWHRWQTDNQFLWASVAREQGQFTLHCEPGSVASALSQVWLQQPFVLIGRYLDQEKNAPIYRQQLGLGELTCLKFSPEYQSDHMQLYLPDRLPMPNSPQFQAYLIPEIRNLVNLSNHLEGPAIVLIKDVPLKAQVGATMAAEFGSRVQVEKTNLGDNSVLISSWEFWQEHQAVLPTPQLLVITSLPIPSLENPRVAGQVAYYKQQRADWFRLYLLPTALRELQQAVIPLRESQGIVALLDNRVNHRSYGGKILAALEPCARIDYIDQSGMKMGLS